MGTLRPSPWRLGDLSVTELCRRVWAEIIGDNVTDAAASLSYYVLFALFPTLLFLTALIGLLPMPDLMDQFLGYADRVLPDETASLVRRTLREIVSGASGGLLSVGALAALWAASSGMTSVSAALNAAYDHTDLRPWWWRRLTSIGLTVGFAAFTLTALLLLVFGRQLGDLVAHAVGLGEVFALAWSVLRWPAAILCALMGVNLVYVLAPLGVRRWSLVTPGAVFALTAWLLMSLGLRVYAGHFVNYNAAYGSIGGVILLMLWLYLSAIALLVGAEINAEIARAQAAHQRGGPSRTGGATSEARGVSLPQGAETSSPRPQRPRADRPRSRGR